MQVSSYCLVEDTFLQIYNSLKKCQICRLNFVHFLLCHQQLDSGHGYGNAHKNDFDLLISVAMPVFYPANGGCIIITLIPSIVNLNIHSQEYILMINKAT